MRRFLATVLFGLAAAASVSFVDGQHVTATSKEDGEESSERIVDVGFMEMRHSDAVSDEFVAALETDALLEGKGRT